MAQFRRMHGVSFWREGPGESWRCLIGVYSAKFKQTKWANDPRRWMGLIAIDGVPMTTYGDTLWDCLRALREAAGVR